MDYRCREWAWDRWLTRGIGRLKPSLLGYRSRAPGGRKREWIEAPQGGETLACQGLDAKRESPSGIAGSPAGDV